MGEIQDLKYLKRRERRGERFSDGNKSIKGEISVVNNNKAGFSGKKASTGRREQEIVWINNMGQN